MVLRMSAATLVSHSPETSDTRRKTLLAESDVLLDDVESLRLQDRTETPPQLREAIRALQLRLGRRNPPLPPATLHAAHDLVFAVQQRLMAANPNLPGPNRHTGRPSGQPLVTVVRDDRVWKVLTLPPPPNGSEEPGVDLARWLDLIDSTVERAWGLRAAACDPGGAGAFQGAGRHRRRAGGVDQLLGPIAGGRPDQGALARPARRRKECSSSYLIGASDARILAAKSSRKRRNPSSSSPVAASMTLAAASR